MNFEKRFIENVKRFNTTEERIQASKNMIDDFFNNEFKQIEKLELEMIDKTEKLANSFYLWSVFNPVMFYKSVNNELGSRGYKSYISFYQELQQKQKQFIRYYFDKRFNGNNLIVEPFLKDEEYIYKLKPSLPAYFGLGLLIHFIYIILLLFIGFLRFKSVMFPLEKNEIFSQIDLKPKKGKHFSYIAKPKARYFTEQVFNVFIGRPGSFSGKISIDGENIVTREKKNFVYLPSPEALPGNIKVKALINIFAGLFKIEKSDVEKVKGEFKNIIRERFEKIEEVNKVNLMLRFAAFKKFNIYLFNNFLENINDKKTAHHIIDELKKEDILIFEINTFVLTYIEYDRLSNILLSKDSNYTKYKEDIIWGRGRE